MKELQPTESGATSSSKSSALQQPRLVPVALIWAVFVAVAGGLATGKLIVKFGYPGPLALWGVGALGGFVSRKITRAACPIAGYWLAIACVLAGGLADVSWYHWDITLPDEVNGGRRDPTWTEALVRTPTFLWQGAPSTLLVTVIASIFGALEAYRQAGRRYRLVAVED